MRLFPRSLFGRLLAISIVSTAVALVVAGFAIGHVLDRFVMRGFDDRLDAQIGVLARAIRPNGTLDTARAVDLPGYGGPAAEWVWRVDGPAGHWASGVNSVVVPPAPPHRRDDDDRPRPFEGRDRRGERVHARTAAIQTPAGAVTIVASGPRRIAEAPLREAMLPLLLSIGLLGVVLALATLLQLKLGLRPLVGLRSALAEVRGGARRHVPTDQPLELQPLVSELNALIDQNEAGLAHARQHVANLAHGLKNPLAALSIRLAEERADPDGSLSEMVATIDRRVRHHLGRARAATPGGAIRGTTPIRPAVEALAAVLTRIHGDRPLSTRIAIADDLATAVDPQDLDEMIGNLFDNAWRHARTAIAVTATVDGRMAAIEIADDGPGLDDAAIAEALLPGRRLDERGDGHGFGLPIARELAELHGGRLTLARSATGGLAATLHLPLTAAPAPPRSA